MKRAYAIRRSRAAGWARLCGGLAVPMLVLAALGTRTGVIPAPALLPVLVVGFVLGLLAFGVAVYALADIWNNGAEGTRVAVAGIVYALPALLLLGLIAAAAITYPRLTDITTNPDDPPEFIRRGAPEGTPHGETTALQQEAYPDLVTRLYPLPLGEVYAAVRTIIQDRGWTIVRDSRPTVMPTTRSEGASTQVGETEEIVRALALKSVMTQSRGAAEELAESAAARAELRETAGNIATLEATAPTLIFGFRDEVVVRLRGTPEGTEVDMRSASEIGAHDLGQNARRVRAFFAKLDSVLLPDPGAPGVSGFASAGQ
jgi:uncharacterized protein (DUF1499 family)